MSSPPSRAPAAAPNAVAVAELDALLVRVRQLDYVRMLGLSCRPTPKAVRRAAQALRASVASARGEAEASEAACAEIVAAVDDAEAVLCDPLRAGPYAARQHDEQT